jgi:16S rRNA (uracil1498-N3)-methyltransferase
MPVTDGPSLLAGDLGRRSHGEMVPIDEDGAGHLRAARTRPGDELRLTDGRGSLWSARLVALDRHGARCTLIDELTAPSDLAVELAFGIAAKHRTLWLVEKAVELGVEALQPIEFARSRSVSDAARSPEFWRKADRRAVAAMLQCGGASLPSLGRPRELASYLKELETAKGIKIVLDTGGDLPLLEALGDWPGRGTRARLLVGPEGGMTKDERAACRSAGLRFAFVGDRTLRFETAALAAATAARLLSVRVAAK